MNIKLKLATAAFSALVLVLLLPSAIKAHASCNLPGSDPNAACGTVDGSCPNGVLNYGAWTHATCKQGFRCTNLKRRQVYCNKGGSINLVCEWQSEAGGVSQCQPTDCAWGSSCSSS